MSSFFTKKLFILKILDYLQCSIYFAQRKVYNQIRQIRKVKTHERLKKNKKT